MAIACSQPALLSYLSRGIGLEEVQLLPLIAEDTCYSLYRAPEEQEGLSLGGFEI